MTIDDTIEDLKAKEARANVRRPLRFKPPEGDRNPFTQEPIDPEQLAWDEFVVAAVNALPSLLGEIERLAARDEEISRLKASIHSMAESAAARSVELQNLKRAYALMHDATIVLRNGMGGHGHWDSTMKHGVGCPVCIDQRTARDEATRIIEAAWKLTAMQGEADAK